MIPVILYSDGLTGLYVFLGLILFFAFFGVLAAVIVPTSISSYKREQERKQNEFVKQKSEKLTAIKNINSKYSFYKTDEKKKTYIYDLNSKKEFDNFDYAKAFKETFFKYEFDIREMVKKGLQDLERYREYKKEIGKIKPTDPSVFKDISFIDSTTFYSLEEKYSKAVILNIYTGAELIIRSTYESPAGRRYYTSYRALKLDDIIEYFKNYFGEDLRNWKENEERINAVNNVVSMLDKKIYTINEIINLFKKNNAAVDQLIARSTLKKAGYSRWKSTNYYVDSSIKGANDLILSSADSNGLITYNNVIKDAEYDDAIERLEKEGRIIPIDNLHFLKISKYLNYMNITLDEISSFESLLLDYSRKNQYFSYKQIIEDIRCPVTETDFEECFIMSIIKYCGFVFPVPGIDKLFSSKQKPQRIMFLEWLMRNQKSVDAFDLIYDLKEMYGIEYSIYSILYDLEKNKTKLYYNPEMEKLYSDKEFFFKELEDVL